MARKQSDYLANLLADDEVKSAPISEGSVGEAPSPSPSPAMAPADSPTTTSRAGLSLLGRENALARVASGEVRQITQLLLDPARVRIWGGNARIQRNLTEENCRDLIDSIIAEGGQKVPAVVRHIQGNRHYDYELIAGSRRHFAISWLRVNSYPDMKLLAQVADLDDEAAFRLADIENRARKDISDIERAKNYAEALTTHYGGRAVRMAERLKLSKSWLSRMLAAAAIPDKVLEAFANLHELSLSGAYKLALALEDKERAAHILREAIAIEARNNNDAVSALPHIPGKVVLERLLAAGSEADSGKDAEAITVMGKHGRTILSVKAVSRQGITLHLPMASGADDADIAAAVAKVLADLRAQGVSLK